MLVLLQFCSTVPAAAVASPPNVVAVTADAPLMHLLTPQLLLLEILPVCPELGCVWFCSCLSLHLALHSEQWDINHHASSFFVAFMTS